MKSYVIYDSIFQNSTYNEKRYRQKLQKESNTHISYPVTINKGRFVYEIMSQDCRFRVRFPVRSVEVFKQPESQILNSELWVPVSL